jgi:DNA-binding NarL/FixJ family response regulator
MGIQKLNRPSRKINVVVVEDHPLFRQGLEKALGMAEDIALLGHADNGAKGLQQASTLNPDVVLLDVNLPDQNGHQVARKLTAEHPNIAVVMLTAYHDVHQELFAMRSGASAYCAKDISPDELIAVIRDVAKGLFVVNSKRLQRDELEQWIHSQLDSVTGPYTEDSEQHLIPLSPRETEILRSVTGGMSNKEIASELGISQQTVKNHMTSILRKLNVEDRTQAAVTALRYGWVRLQERDAQDKQRGGN